MIGLRDPILMPDLAKAMGWKLFTARLVVNTIEAIAGRRVSVDGHRGVQFVDMALLAELGPTVEAFVANRPVTDLQSRVTGVMVRTPGIALADVLNEFPGENPVTVKGYWRAWRTANGVRLARPLDAAWDSAAVPMLEGNPGASLASVVAGLSAYGEFTQSAVATRLTKWRRAHGVIWQSGKKREGKN